MTKHLIGCELKQVYRKDLYYDHYFFLICINDLLDHLVSSVKFSADDTSLFSTVYDTNASRNILNDFLKKY